MSSKNAGTNGTLVLPRDVHGAKGDMATITLAKTEQAKPKILTCRSAETVAHESPAELLPARGKTTFKPSQHL
ncbi:MAG: hypothetical protein MUF81_16070 [Verrucomicrobia bacterium]|jgi:hypothetical protein|nr:hypothetical protein [Verrucomicrobiota bacterium]